MPSVDNSRRKQRVAESDSEEDDAGGNNDAVLAKVDPEFLNKPIDLQQGQSKLKLIVMGLKTAEKQLGEVANALFDVAQETAEQLSEAYQDGYDEDEMMKVFREDPSLSGLDREFRWTASKIQELEIRAAVVSDMRTRLLQGHQMTNLYGMYEEKVKQPLEEYRAKTPRQRFLNDKKYKGFTEQVWDQLTSGQGVPNLKKFLPRDEADDEESDDELEVGAQQQNYTCPLTLEDFEDPYTSNLCPHSFSGSAIKELIKQDHGSTKCPVPGCSKTLTMASIEKDEHLARRTQAHQKRVREGRTQATQGGGGGKTYQTMDLSDDEGDDE